MEINYWIGTPGGEIQKAKPRWQIMGRMLDDMGLAVETTTRLAPNRTGSFLTNFISRNLIHKLKDLPLVELYSPMYLFVRYRTTTAERENHELICKLNL